MRADQDRLQARIGAGKPADQVNDRVLGMGLPLRIRQWLFHLTMRATVGDLTRFGLPKPDHKVFETHPIANSQLVYHIGHGGIVPVPDVERFERNQVIFTDGRTADPDVVVLATLNSPAESAAATQTVRELREDLDAVNPDIKVGGSTAILLDTRETTDSDRRKVIPAILVVIFLVLALLLRSLAAPLLLLLANVLSFGATMGIAAIMFNYVFDFPASDPSTMLIGFVFLVALGIDYSIFLMTRVREESIRQGTHPGVLKGLSVTGGVITSAGVVLAATFAALSVVPILFLAQIAFIVAFGVLLDTLVVRSLLVPALAYDLGPRVWWPSRLWHTPDHADRETAEMLHAGQADGVRID